MDASFSCPCGKTAHVNTADPASAPLAAFDATVRRHFAGDHS